MGNGERIKAIPVPFISSTKENWKIPDTRESSDNHLSLDWVKDSVKYLLKDILICNQPWWAYFARDILGRHNPKLLDFHLKKYDNLSKEKKQELSFSDYMDKKYWVLIKFSKKEAEKLEESIPLQIREMDWYKSWTEGLNHLWDEVEFDLFIPNYKIEKCEGWIKEILDKEWYNLEWSKFLWWGVPII